MMIVMMSARWTRGWMAVHIDVHEDADDGRNLAPISVDAEGVALRWRSVLD